MQGFVKVRKDNRNHDRGFIAVDAICAAFENRDAHNVEIMTMDGFWYEVEDDIDELFAKVSAGRDVPPPKEGRASEAMPQGKLPFAKHRRLMMPAAKEDGAQQKSHEEARRVRSNFAYPKRGYAVRGKRSFPLDGGEGCCGLKAKAADATPPETERL